MRDLITSILDAIALLAIAAGIGAGLARWIGWFGLAVAGAVLLAGSLTAHGLSDAPTGSGEQ